MAKQKCAELSQRDPISQGTITKIGYRVALIKNVPSFTGDEITN